MSIKQTTRRVALGVISVMALVAVPVVSSSVVMANSCAGTETAIITCDGGQKDATNLQDTGLWRLLISAINFLLAGVGIAAIGGIVYGAVLYTASGGNPEQVKKARMVFTNVVIGVVAFGGMYSLLNFIVPGGVFNSGTPNSCDARVLGVPPWYRGVTNNVAGDCALIQPGQAGTMTTTAFVWHIVLNVVEIALVLTAYIAVFFIIYGGFLWLTGGARPDMVAKGRKAILNAAIGLAISMAAIGLSNLLFGILG